MNGLFDTGTKKKKKTLCVYNSMEVTPEECALVYSEESEVISLSLPGFELRSSALALSDLRAPM